MYKPPFDITSEMLRLISEISEQVGIINMRLGENAPSPHLRKKSQIKTIHSSRRWPLSTIACRLNK